MADKTSQLHLTPVVFHTLLALSDGPQHGYQISKTTAEMSDGSVKMGPGTLYGSLQRMQVAGLLEEVAPPDDLAGPHSERRRYYGITEAGRSALLSEGRRLARAVQALRDRDLLASDEVPE